MGDRGRWMYGMVAVLGGLVALTVCYTIAVLRFDEPGDAATAMAAVTGAIGTLAGAYFGVQVGSAGKEAAEERAAEMAEQAMRFAAIADPDRAIHLLGPGGPDGPPPGGAGAPVPTRAEGTEVLDWNLVEDAPKEKARVQEQPKPRTREAGGRSG